MTRSHRAWHRVIWIALAVIVGTGFVLALALRPAPAATVWVAAEEAR
jgi:integral membrane sensor domain MASE1